MIKRVPGIRGVTFQRFAKNHHYQARIKHDNRQIALGYYATAEEAGRVYDVAARLLHGPGTPVNFDGDPPPTVARADIFSKLYRARAIRSLPQGIS